MDGYISKFDVYQGKTDTSSGDSEDNGIEQEFGLGEQVVQTMTKDLFGKYYQVYFDTFSYIHSTYGVSKSKWC